MSNELYISVVKYINVQGRDTFIFYSENVKVSEFNSEVHELAESTKKSPGRIQIYNSEVATTGSELLRMLEKENE